MKTNFEIWRDSDNVFKTAENGYKTQCGQYKKTHTEDELKAYFIKEYCDNNKERADEIADLFEHTEILPFRVREILYDFEQKESSYEDCKKLVSELESVGYTCEYGLDNIPHSLIKLETTNETPEDMKTENIVFEHENKQVIKKGNHFFTRVTENGESFESGDFNTLERAKESLGIYPKHTYTTVLKSISIHTVVFKKAFEMCQKFDEEIKYKSINTDEYWQAQAYRDFINLLEEEVKEIKALQNDTLNKLTFLIK